MNEKYLGFHRRVIKDTYLYNKIEHTESLSYFYIVFYPLNMLLYGPSQYSFGEENILPNFSEKELKLRKFKSMSSVSAFKT